ncbi:MAG: hypothetical protein KBG84_02855 [Planctomycetes bacterium]|nr:hypothetical protein [Planctomycetota bacterium]
MADSTISAEGRAEERVFRPFEASSSAVEVDGRTVRSVISGMMLRSVGLELLRREGLDPVKPERWYPMQSWLNVFRTISERLGADTLYSVGYRIPQAAEFPAHMMKDVATALQSIDIAYHNAHRNGEIGCYEYSQLGEGVYQVRCNNPYPCDFDLGIIDSLVDRFRGSQVYNVLHVASACRKLGGNECRYQVVRQPR